MATWIPAPSVPVQAYGGDSPLTGKFPYGEALGQTIQQPPSPPWVGAPAGNRLIATNITSYNF